MVKHRYGCETQNDFEKSIVEKYDKRIWNSVNEYFEKSKSILDIGGGCYFSGIDTDKRSIIDLTWGEEGISCNKIHKGNIENYDFGDEKFDGFFMSNVLYYLSLDDTFKNIKKHGNIGAKFLSICSDFPGSFEDRGFDYSLCDTSVSGFLGDPGSETINFFMDVVKDYMTDHGFGNIKMKHLGGKIVITARIKK